VDVIEVEKNIQNQGFVLNFKFETRTENNVLALANGMYYFTPGFKGAKTQDFFPCDLAYVCS